MSIDDMVARDPRITELAETDDGGTITHAKDMSRPHSGRDRVTEERVAERIRNWAGGIRVTRERVTR